MNVQKASNNLLRNGYIITKTFYYKLVLSYLIVESYCVFINQNITFTLRFFRSEVQVVNGEKVRNIFEEKSIL